MLHFAIVEDLPSDQEDLVRKITENLKAHGETAGFSCYESGESFLATFRPDCFHAVFLDIMLGKDGLNGFETAKQLRLTAERIPLIFTTSERDYSLDCYRVHPLDYLLKPVDERNLDWCLNEIRNSLSDPSYIEVSATAGQGQSSLRRILLDDILYAESQNHRLIIHTVEGDIAARLSFTEFMALLPDGGRFYLGGRGLLLNFSQVSSVDEEGMVHLKTGGEFFVSRRKKKETKEAFADYLFHCLRKGRTV